MSNADQAVLRFASVRKGNALYEELRKQIVRGSLRPGEPLIESALAKGYGCSQGTVREALMRLQEDGLVIRNGYRGTAVSTTTLAEAQEMQILRRRLETQGVRRAMAQADDAWIKRLSDMVRAMEQVAEAGDGYRLAELDCEFHLAIFGRAGLPALEPILSRCMLHLHRLSLAKADRARALMTSATRHWAIVEALKSGDPEEAACALEHHINTIMGTGAAGQEA